MFVCFPWPDSSSVSRPSHCWSFEITLGRTPLDEWSARRRDLYLTTHNTHKRYTSMHPAEFEPAIPVSERPQTHALDRPATGIGPLKLWNLSNTQLRCGMTQNTDGCGVNWRTVLKFNFTNTTRKLPKFLQHCNFQLMHTTLKNVELLRHFKIRKAAPTCFGLQGNHHQGATVST